MEITINRSSIRPDGAPDRPGGPDVWDPIVGIDLGTTNSLVAVVRPGAREPEVLSLADGSRLVPSVVSFGEEGEPEVGRAARSRKLRQPERTIFSVKRLLGRDLRDLDAQSRELPYELMGDPERGIVRVRAGGQAYTPVEISALILRELKRTAERALGVPVRRAVVTVPAYFNDSQRQATRAAGRLAGLQVLRIINEPTAAALAYGVRERQAATLAVYDLGGGTFDVSILRLKDGVFEVLATGGDTALGGDDLDAAIARWALAGLGESGDLEGLDAETRASLLEGAERLKIELSDHPRARVQLDSGRFATREIELEREQMESIVMSVLERTRAPCLRALKDAGVESLTVGAKARVDQVLLVGGPTRLPVVRRLVAEIFGQPPNVSVHPDEVVALGAAVQADILAGGNPDLLLLDVTPLSLGIETYGGLMSVLIPRLTRIPTSVGEFFTTFVDQQTGVDIHVLQGERDLASENRSLARFKLGGIPPLPAGVPRIEVSFLLDADGILQVGARDLRTGIESSIEVRPSFGLTDAEVDRMLEASLSHAESDIRHRRLVEARTEAEPALRATLKRLEEARTALPPEEVAGIEGSVQGLRVALGGDDPAQIDQALRELNQATQRLAERLVQQALHGATRG